LKKAKQFKKLIRLVSKAQQCDSREEAQKIIKKAEKVKTKLSA
tara:strand:- start:364 stop:492 length:129 start_codon:yes stop_codon:yes gene_type:complete